MSTHASSGKFFTKTLYSFNNVPIGATGSTGSEEINVTSYYTKTAYGFISGSSLSGSLTISGSFDNTNWFKITGSGVFNSATSVGYVTLTEPVTSIKISLYNNYTGSAVSGSLYLVTS